jgi:hypothetical protein
MAMQNGDPSSFLADFWRGAVEEWDPQAYYTSPTGRAFGRQSPRRSRYFSNAYEDIWKDYLGATGTGQLEGQAPVSFMEFLEGNPWTARYANLPQIARGATGRAANPRTRFLYNF